MINRWEEKRIGKKEQWIEKDGGTGVRWDGLERPLTRRRRKKSWNKTKHLLISYFFT